MSIIRDTVEREREATRDTLVASLRSNVNINGGGVITWDSNGYFNSTSRFIVIANGRGAFFSTNGYFSISIPTSGTILGVGGASNVTATSAGIPISNWQALYYILPIGSNNASIASNFRIVSYTSDVVIPDNWVLLAVNNLDTNTLSITGGKYTLHKGESIDATKYSSAFVPKDTLVASLRANVNISGGGVITWDSNGYFNSTSRFIVIANGRGAFFSTNGFFDITIPTSGTIQGVGGASNVTATSAGIPISNWQALYYILPIGSGNVSIASNFRIASYTSDVVIPDNWVLVASRNGDNNTLSIAGGKYTLHQGGSVDTTKYSSAFVPNADLVGELPTDFTSSKATNGYQKLPSGLIIQWMELNKSMVHGESNILTFPIAFPTSLLGVTQGYGDGVDTTTTSIYFRDIARSTTSITYQYGAVNGGTYTTRLRIIAIGY